MKKIFFCKNEGWMVKSEWGMRDEGWRVRDERLDIRWEVRVWGYKVYEGMRIGGYEDIKV